MSNGNQSNQRPHSNVDSMVGLILLSRLGIDVLTLQRIQDYPAALCFAVMCCCTTLLLPGLNTLYSSHISNWNGRW